MSGQPLLLLLREIVELSLTKSSLAVAVNGFGKLMFLK